MQTKTLAMIRQEMRTGQPFSITYCSYSASRKTGGKRVTLRNVTLVQGSESNAPATEPTIREAALKPAHGTARNPNHFAHGTFNIRKIAGGIEKVRWVLIEKFNGFRVTI